jgi:phage protein D
MKVAFKVVVDGGQDITALIADRLLSLEITDEAGVKSDRLTITIDDRDQRLEFPKTGTALEASLGYVGTPLVKMGRYVVDEVDVSGPVRTLIIRANAADMTGSIKAPKERSWPGVTLGTLVRTIAADNGLQPSIGGDLAARQLGHVDQTESDMQLLQRVCTEQGATCKVADGRLVVAVRASGKTASGRDLPSAVIDASRCESWSAVVARRNDYKAVRAYWQDTGAAERRSVTAGSGRPMLELKNSYASQAEARRAAESKLKALARGADTVRIAGLVGDPTMSAEMTALLSGFRAGIDGDNWVINSVAHSVSGDGYTCALELESKD